MDEEDLVKKANDDEEEEQKVRKTTRKRSVRLLDQDMANNIITSKRQVVSIKSSFAAENFVFFDKNSTTRKSNRRSLQETQITSTSATIPDKAKKIKLEEENNADITSTPVMNGEMAQPQVPPVKNKGGRPRKYPIQPPVEPVEEPVVKDEPKNEELTARSSKRIRKESLKKISILLLFE